MRLALRLPMGAIQAAVLAVAAAEQTPMRPCEVLRAVEHRLGRAVSYDTVSSFLSVAARDPAMPVARAYGQRYVTCR